MATEWITKFTDHSNWNTINSWNALYDLGIRVVLLRASSGGTYIDPKFKTHYTGARIAGHKILAYHASHPYYSAEANIANFRRAVTGYPLDGYPVLDCQLTGGQSYAVARSRNISMFYLIKSLYGGGIGYSAKWFWDPVMGMSGLADEFPMIVANYYDALSGDKWPSPTAYAGTVPTEYASKEPFAWQFSDKGLFLAASPGNMDKNVGYRKFYQHIFPPYVIPDPPVFPDIPRIQMQSGLNIYANPDRNSAIVGALSAGHIMYVTQEEATANDRWCRIGYRQYVHRVLDSKIYATYL